MAEKDKQPHYKPQHPLPAEIQKMNKDETVCRYCGVSYLIHNEIKRLEEKLKSVQNELENYKGCKEREDKLLEEMKKLTEEKNQLNTTLSARDSVVSTLTNDLKKEEELYNNLNRVYKELENTLSDTTKDRDLYKMKHRLLYERLPTTAEKIKEQKNDLREIYDFVENRNKQMNQIVNIIMKNVESVVEKEVKEKEQRLIIIKNLEEEIVESNTHRENTSKLQQLELSYEALITKCKSLEKNCKDQEQIEKGLRDDKEKSELKSRSFEMEIKQFKDLLKNKTHEIEEINSQMRRKGQDVELQLQKSQNEVRRKEEELYNVNKQMKDLENKLREYEIKEEEGHRKANLTLSEKKELKEALAKSKNDLQALKKEREDMIISHQNRIEQLRESFKNKVADMENWPEKLESALQKERTKHAVELRNLEEKLNEGFAMELQIEKQKYQELMEKYQAGNKENESKLKAEIQTMEIKYRGQIQNLQQMLTDNKARGQDIEGELRSEIENLKGIIKNLENRLATLDSGSNELVVKLKSQLQETHSELEDTRDEVNRLEKNLQNAKEENMFLQETVKNECEERFELTEALSEAREQLLQFKKPAGGYTSVTSPKYSSGGTARTPSVSENSVEQPELSERSVTRDIPYRQSNFKSYSASSTGSNQSSTNSSIREPLNSNSVNVGFNYDEVKSSGKLKGNSLNSTRKRIANILGRK